MRMWYRLAQIMVLIGLPLLILCGPSLGEEREQKPIQLRKPLTLEEMTPYETISFEKENFEKIKRGMTEEAVLEVLGKPETLEKEHRRGNRWTVHYSYPGGYVVNFKDGLVVGKESP